MLIYRDYYPFGMVIPNRSASSTAYRYGFQGQEKDDELKGEGNSYTTFWRQFDPRIGRWLSVDPKTAELPSETPYSFAGNMPIFANDAQGDICVPCIIIVGGLLMTPEVAMAPTNDTKADMKAYINAKDLQTQWIATSMTAGLAGRPGAVKAIWANIKTQAYINGGINLTAELYRVSKGKKDFDLTQVLKDTYNGIDLFDASVGQLGLKKMTEIIASATIDLTPEEAKVVGLGDGNKSISEVAVDVVISQLNGKINGKVDGLNVSKTLKNIFKKADDAIMTEFNNEIKDFTKELFKETERNSRIKTPTNRDIIKDKTSIKQLNTKK